MNFVNEVVVLKINEQISLIRLYYWNTYFLLTVIHQGRVEDLAFFQYLSPFCFLSIEFHCAFSISYKILPYFVYYYCILVRM